MDQKKFFRIHLYFTATVTLAIASLLLWNFYHGGVPSHHILANPDLPSISNWWGGLVLPALTWFLLYRIQKRALNQDKPDALAGISRGFFLALVYGVLLAISFVMGYSQVSSYLALGMFGLAVIFPIYRSEFLLGFVIGMTYTFGAVLPTIVGSLVAMLSASFHFLVRPLFFRFVSLFSSPQA